MKRNVMGDVAVMPAPAVQAHSLREHLPSEILAPMLAGARARGIADAYEMMGLGVILLNDSGRVLHLSARARILMEGTIDIVSEHMVAATPEANSAIGRLIAAGIAGEQNQQDGIVLESEAKRRVCVRAIPVPGHETSEFQLLKAVVVLSDA